MKAGEIAYRIRRVMYEQTSRAEMEEKFGFSSDELEEFLSIREQEQKKAWEYEQETGHLMCKCPECRCRLFIGKYAISNPYRFCPYCGEKLDKGDFERKRKEIYGEDELWET